MTNRTRQSRIKRINTRDKPAHSFCHIMLRAFCALSLVTRFDVCIYNTALYGDIFSRQYL